MAGSPSGPYMVGVWPRWAGGNGSYFLADPHAPIWPGAGEGFPIPLPQFSAKSTIGAHR